MKKLISKVVRPLLCIVITAVVMMSVCTMAMAETPEQRVERVYPNWKEDWEEWNKKELVEEYDTETFGSANQHSGLEALDMKALVVGVIEHESRFQGDVGSKYRGLMQISTSKDVLNFVGVSADSLYDERTNIRCGVKMLEYYLSKSEGNVERALCWYGCGEGASKKRSTYCKTGQEIYILYKKYKALFEQEEMSAFLVNELNDRKNELDNLITLSESANSKMRSYYQMRIKNVEDEIAELEKMLG